MKKYFAVAAIILGVGIFMFVLFKNSQATQTPRTFSPYTLLTSSWENYKKKFINPDGRVLDLSVNPSVTTSEGQSYALLRAVWIDDKDEFDLVWNWTKNTLQKKNLKLFGWHWGQISKNQYGFLPNGGDNSAADADSDIALALILASHRWQQNVYLDEARKILPDLWKEEVATAGGKNYLVAGNWAKNNDEIVVNPSYFSPAAWRLFAQVDKDSNRNWSGLIPPAYDLLEKSSSSSAGLPPDWLTLQRKTGTVIPNHARGLTDNYSFDAFRIPWRIALDYFWNNSPEAKNYLSNHFQKLHEDFQTQNRLASSYSHSGEILEAAESPAMYAASLGYFLVADPALAKTIYEQKIIKLYSNDANSFLNTLPYYDQNWLWFGSAMYNKQLIKY